MEWHLLWKAVIIVIGGTVLLRFAGRKSISQMTLAQTVVMIGIGSLLVQPIVGKNIWTTLLVGLVFVLTLIIMEYLQVKRDIFENLLTGKSKVLIENGVIQQENLRKFRLTVDQLEMNLRQQNIQRTDDIQWAMLETNGRVAVILKEDAQPVTKKEFKELTSMLEQALSIQPSSVSKQSVTPEQQETIFAEVKRKSHKNTPPEHLK